MDKLRIGVVGLGFGAYLIETQLAQGPGAEVFELAAVCDANPARLEPQAAKYGVTGYQSLDALLDDESIPVVGLFSGPNGRAELISRCLRAGKHVMTTKPFELDPAAARQVLEEARALGKIVALNSPPLALSDDFRQMRQWQEQYQLGRPLAARHECWYQRVEAPDGSWYDDADRCPVAPVFRLGIYGINALVQIFGAPAAVQVLESRIFTGRPTPDLAQLSIHFQSGAIATTLDGFCLQPPRGAEALSVFYENGAIHRAPITEGIPNGQTILAVVPAAHEDGVPAERRLFDKAQLSHCYQWDRFARAVRGDMPADPTPPEVIVDGVRILAAMHRASQQNCTVAVE